MANRPNFFHHIFLSAIISNDRLHAYDDPCNLKHAEWTNPWDDSISSSKDFYQLMDDAREIYINRIRLYQKWEELIAAERNSKTGAAGSETGQNASGSETGQNARSLGSKTGAVRQELLSDLGDNSYDSGLPWARTLEISKVADSGHREQVRR